MNLKSSYDFIEKELTRYFECRLIGSALLYPLLDMNLIQDIDIAIASVSKIRQYLEDQGFNETQKPISVKGYTDTEGSLVFVNKEYDKPIHLSITGNTRTYTIEELLCEKIKRGSKSDWSQLRNYITNKLLNNENT